MINDIKKAFELIKYGHGIKSNSVGVVLCFLVGMVLEIISGGQLYLGSFLVVMAAMFPVQILYSLNITGAITSSTYRKKMQTIMPTIINVGLILVTYTVLVVIKLVEFFRIDGEGRAAVGLNTIYLIIIMDIVLLYMGFTYKFFVLSVFTIAIISFVSSFITSSQLGNNRILGNTGIFFGILVIGYVMVFVAGGLQYLISCAVYKAKISKFAMSGKLRKYM